MNNCRLELTDVTDIVSISKENARLILQEYCLTPNPTEILRGLLRWTRSGFTTICLRENNNQNRQGRTNNDKGEESPICRKGRGYCFFFWDSKGILFINYLETINAEHSGPETESQEKRPDLGKHLQRKDSHLWRE